MLSELLLHHRFICQNFPMQSQLNNLQVLMDIP